MEVICVRHSVEVTTPWILHARSIPDSYGMQLFVTQVQKQNLIAAMREHQEMIAHTLIYSVLNDYPIRGGKYLHSITGFTSYYGRAPKIGDMVDVVYHDDKWFKIVPNNVPIIYTHKVTKEIQTQQERSAQVISQCKILFPKVGAL